MSIYSNISRVNDFIVNSKALITIKSIIGEPTKNSKKNPTNLSRFDN
jgi:hypothetical protein